MGSKQWTKKWTDRLDWTSKSGNRLALLGACLAVAACGGSGGSAPGSQTGTLSISLTDAARWDVDEIWLQITGISVKPSGDGPAIDFDFGSNIVDVDLLTLTPDNAAQLLDSVTVPAGAYNWIELHVNAAYDNVTDDSYVVETGGGMVELRVPSSSVRLVSGFTVVANTEKSIMIDWDVRQGLVKPPGQAGYLLRPAFRIIDMQQSGTLSGTVDTNYITDVANDCNADSPTDDLDVGNVVYVFADFGATPDDIDGLDATTDPNVDPVATVEVNPDSMGDYTFSTLLAPGRYTVAFTCQSGLDDPAADDTLLFTAGADVEIFVDQESTVAF